MRHKLLLSLWLLMTTITGVTLLAPLSNSGLVPLFLNHGDDRVFKVERSTNESLFFSCTHNVSFTLVGKPEGYAAKPSIDFYISIRSVNASGVYRFNSTIYYNNHRVEMYIRDETFEAGSTLSTGVRFEPHEWNVTMENGEVVEYGKEWIEWNRYLKSGNNTVIINTTLTPLMKFNELLEEFQFGDGEINASIGPMKVQVWSLDVDKDGIPDATDPLRSINNYALLPMLGIAYLPISAYLQYATHKVLRRRRK